MQRGPPGSEVLCGAAFLDCMSDHLLHDTCQSTGHESICLQFISNRDMFSPFQHDLHDTLSLPLPLGHHPLQILGKCTTHFSLPICLPPISNRKQVQLLTHTVAQWQPTQTECELTTLLYGSLFLLSCTWKEDKRERK